MSNPETTSTRTVRPTIQTATIYLDGTTAPGSWFLAPATNPTDEYAAGYDGNEFASEAEALAGIPQLRQCGEEFAAVDWFAVQRHARRARSAPHVAEVRS